MKGTKKKRWDNQGEEKKKAKQRLKSTRMNKFEKNEENGIFRNEEEEGEMRQMGEGGGE